MYRKVQHNLLKPWSVQRVIVPEKAQAGWIPTGASIRAGRDNAAVKGDFVIALSASSIYKLFKSKFDGTLNEFTMKPKQVAQLGRDSITYFGTPQDTKQIINNAMKLYS